MKRILAITLTLVMLLAALTGCMASKNPSGIEGEQNPSGKRLPISVYICRRTLGDFFKRSRALLKKLVILHVRSKQNKRSTNLAVSASFIWSDVTCVASNTD